MKTQTSNDAARYFNPRIDSQTDIVNAVDGAVSPDPVKILWVGSMLIGGTIGSALTMNTGAVIVFVVSALFTLCFGHSLGMHRRFIHRSYSCPQWLEYILVHFGTIVGIAGPLSMLKTHDIRDWAQRQTKCHDYFSHSQKWYRDLWWQMFCSVKLVHPPEIQIEKTIAEDRVYALMEKTWMLQQVPWALLFFWLGGWSWVFWGICSRVSVSIFGHWIIGFFAHNEGERSWHVVGAATQGYNISWAALLTMGESWHNNHHAFPGSARLGLKPNQPDPGWWVLLGLQKIGLVCDLKTAKDLPARNDMIPFQEGN
ncbi:MAG: acyl-CoA desaturase [Gammaproteobacteria bacterium]